MLISVRRPCVIAFQTTASLQNIDHVCGMAERFLVEECCEDDFFHFQLGLREALANAMLHGCEGRKERKVLCDMVITKGRLTVNVRDPGPGFDWRELSGREVPPDSERGRGLSIIRRCFDTVSFNDKGNEIILEKQMTCRGGVMSDVVKSQDAATLRPGRDLVASSVEDVRADLSALVEEGIVSLTIDLDGVKMVDSLGMGLLVATHNSLRGKGGHLRLVNVAARIHDILSVMRLTRHFEVHKAEGA